MAATEHAAEPKPRSIVLQLRDVTFDSAMENAVQLREADLEARQSDLVVLWLDRAQACRQLASLIQGLHQPTAGHVLFQNQDWLGDDCERHFRMRSRIGRVFENQGWIQNFNVLENVTLATRHHGSADHAINDRVRSWVRRFGVAEVFYQRPSFVDPAVLQVYQWIRALLGDPALLILERPMNLVSSTKFSPFADVVNEVRRRGTAVLWLTSNQVDFSCDLDSPRIDYTVIDGKLRKVDGVPVDE